MRKDGRYKIIASELGVHTDTVRSIGTGRRGKRQTESQEIILKAVYKADQLDSEADKKLIEYCRSLKVTSVVPQKIVKQNNHK